MDGPCGWGPGQGCVLVLLGCSSACFPSHPTPGLAQGGAHRSLFPVVPREDLISLLCDVEEDGSYLFPGKRKRILEHLKWGGGGANWLYHLNLNID